MILAAPLTFARARVILIAAAIPTLVSAGTAWLGVWDPENAVRALLAAPLGLAVGGLVAAVLTRRLR
jgi:hypothetical protein